jgi:prolyl-tRNA synthetase
VQAGTTHDLGDNFARVFETKYLNENNKECFVHQSSWGVSTRLIGGVIMTHGDDQGLRLPPNLAPVQAHYYPCMWTGFILLYFIGSDIVVSHEKNKLM